MKTNFFILLISSLMTFSVLANEELVINSETAFIATHHNRFSFLLGVNPSLTKATDVTNLSFSFGKKLEEFWLDTHVSMTNGLFKKMTTNNPAATKLTSDDVDLTKNTLFTIGAGLGRETRYIQTLLPFNDLYEYMAADITYNSFKEKNSGHSFIGPGIIAKYSAYKKISDYLSFGPQFTYHLAVVKRTADNDFESSSSRSLTMSHLTVGFDLSFYL